LLHLADENATVTLGARLAAVLGVGDTVLLRGPLGAGKSTLARAIIRGILGDTEADIPSPSYTLVNVYGVHDDAVRPVEVWHADLYRLASADEAYELGLDEAFATALVLVE